MFYKIRRFFTENIEEREARKTIEKVAKMERKEKKRKERERQVEYEKSVERANRINRMERMRYSYFQNMGQSMRGNNSVCNYREKPSLETIYTGGFDAPLGHEVNCI